MRINSLSLRGRVVPFVCLLALASCATTAPQPSAPPASAAAAASTSGFALKEFITQSIGKDNVEAISFSPDSKRLAIGAADGIVAIFSLDSLDAEPVVAKLHGGFVSCLAWSPSGDRLLTAATDGSVRLSDSATLQKTRSFTSYPNSYPAVAWSTDGKQFALSQGRNSVQLFDATTAGLLATLDLPNSTTRDLLWLASGDVVASDDTGQLSFFQTGRSQPVRTFKPNPGHKAVNSLGASPDGKTLLIGYDDGALLLLDAVTGQQPRELVRGRQIGTATWSPSGQLIAVSSVAFELNVYDTQGRQVGHEVIGYDVNGTAWSPDGRYLAVGTDAHDFRIWQLQPPQPAAPAGFPAASFMGR